MIEETFTLYEQLIADSPDYIEVTVDYEAKRPGQIDEDGNHRLALGLRYPDHRLPFAQIRIEFREGQPSIYLWPDPNADEPLIFEPRADDATFCLKCGADWEVHNGDGSCVEEN